MNRLFISLPFVIVSTWFIYYNYIQSASKTFSEFDEEEFLRSYKCGKNHGYRPKIILRDPLVIQMDDFLIKGEAEYLKKISKPLLKPSMVTINDTHGEFDSGRTSYTSFLVSNQDDVVRCIEERTSLLAGYPVENIEPLQVVRYTEGQKFDAHVDYFTGFIDYPSEVMEVSGDRIITVFVYLSSLNEEDGGETEFKNLSLKLRPQKNRALLWYNFNSEMKPDARIMHSGNMVKNQVEKYGLNVWIREKPFLNF